MKTEQLWYKDGLKFKCTQCGKCCTGTPGYVWIEEKEVAEMAQLLHLSIKEFKCKYTRFAHGRLALLEKKVSYDCIFLKDKACQVYGARPQQCRKFPWWPMNLSSRKSWEEAGKACEGINHSEARVVSCKEIAERMLEPNTSPD